MKTVSINEAVSQLDSLAELALQGELVLIRKDSKLLLLQEFSSIEPLPPGALDAIYDEEYVREDNFLAAHSVITPDP